MTKDDSAPGLCLNKSSHGLTISHTTPCMLVNALMHVQVGLDCAIAGQQMYDVIFVIGKLLFNTNI